MSTQSAGNQLSHETISSTRALLACGVVAGPVFVAVAAAQVLIRTGFDPARHPLSLLSLGDAGWVQITNFILAGVLFAVPSIGMCRALRPGKGEVWAPRLIAIFGVGLVAGGVFVADPAFGFPQGTPDGAPSELSWHGIVHGFAPTLGFLALVAASFVVARRFAVDGRRGWAMYSRVNGAVVLVLSALTRSLLPQRRPCLRVRHLGASAFNTRHGQVEGLCHV